LERGIVSRKHNLLKYDQSNMRHSLENWPTFAKNALKMPIDTTYTRKFTNSAIFGMGTPNAVGKIFESRSRIPLVAVDDWTIPHWVGKDTLVLALSYSGNTGEVLTATQQSLKLGAKVIGISSGGKLQEWGATKEFPAISFEPVGRSGYSFPYLFLLSGRILQQLEILNIHIDSESLLKALKIVWGQYDRIDIGETLFRSRTLMVCGGQNTAGLVRWTKHCLNENAKRLVIPLIIPEGNHGEVEAFTELDSRDAIIILREQTSETDGITRSIEIYKELLIEREVSVIELRGDNSLWVTNTLCLAYQGILISFWLALFHQIDPTPLPVIDDLKKKLTAM
jgi:glucose/mannose-6-phosphate isomerase